MRPPVTGPRTFLNTSTQHAAPDYHLPSSGRSAFMLRTRLATQILPPHSPIVTTPRSDQPSCSRRVIPLDTGCSGPLLPCGDSAAGRNEVNSETGAVPGQGGGAGQCEETELLGKPSY